MKMKTASPLNAIENDVFVCSMLSPEAMLPEIKCLSLKYWWLGTAGQAVPI